MHIIVPVMVMIAPRTGAAIRLVPSSVGITFWICGLPGAARTNAPLPAAVAGTISFLGMFSS